MSRRLLTGIIVFLLITNIATLLLWNKGHLIIMDNQSKRFSPGDIVADINGNTITYQEWVNALIHDEGESKLKSIINHEVVSQLANSHGIEVSDKIIKRDLYHLISMQSVQTKEDFQRLEQDLRKEITYRYQLEKLLTKDISIPIHQVQSIYNKHPSQYNFTEAMQISHILVKDFDMANQIKRELDKGISFSSLAKEHSLDRETQNNGGYIGFIHTNSQFLPKDYEKVARSMGEYSYSEPFHTANGVVIMFLHRRLPPITFSFDEIEPYIESELALKKANIDLSADVLWDQLDIEWIYGR